MSLGIKSIRRKRQATRNQWQIVMPSGPQMIAIKSRTIRKINQATKEGRSTINRVVEKGMRIRNQMQREKTDVPVKCVMKRHIQLCLDARNFKGLFQDNQGKVCLMCIGTVYSNCLHKSLKTIKDTSAK